MAEALTIRVRRERGYAVVAIAGEIDIATAAGLREPLSELVAGGRSLVVDLDQVSFIDAAGLGALAGAARRAAGYGASLHVVCARSQVLRLFRLTGLDRLMPLARSLDEAIEALAAARDTPTLAFPRFRNAVAARLVPGQRFPDPYAAHTDTMATLPDAPMFDAAYDQIPAELGVPDARSPASTPRRCPGCCSTWAPPRSVRPSACTTGSYAVDAACSGGLAAVADAVDAPHAKAIQDHPGRRGAADPCARSAARPLPAGASSSSGTSRSLPRNGAGSAPAMRWPAPGSKPGTRP